MLFIFVQITFKYDLICLTIIFAGCDNTPDNTNENGNNICKLNSKKIELPLYIRNKKDGDYIEQLGLNGKKKIKEIFIENKIPKDLRDNYPLLVDSNDTILWIPNIKKSKYNVKKNEFCDIILYSHKEGENLNEEKKQ